MFNFCCCETVKIGYTVEIQALADERLPLFLSFPMKRRLIACCLLPDPIDPAGYLGGVEHVTVNGEFGREAGECGYDWILPIREHCIAAVNDDIQRKRCRRIIAEHLFDIFNL